MKLAPDITAEDMKVFLEEADEQFQLLDEDIIRLEKEGENEALLQEIFRAAHTLKGSSATIGHEKMAQLTHGMESLLDLLRKGEIRVVTAMIDVLLQSLDALRVLKEELVTNEDSEIDITGLLARLKEVSAKDVQPAEKVDEKKVEAEAEVKELALSEKEAAVLLTATNSDVRCYRVRVKIDRRSLLAAARAMQVLMELNAIGTIVRSVPSQEEVEAEKFESDLQLILLTTQDEFRVQDTVNSVSEVDSCETEAINSSEMNDVSAPAEPAGMPEARVGEKTRSTDRNGDEDRRLVDLGPEARGRSREELLQMAAQKGVKAAKTVRIDVERLDNLMNLVGELVIDRTRLYQIASKLEGRFGDDENIAGLTEAAVHVGRITDELQDEIMKSRMLPIENVFNKFPRMVRDLAQKFGKKVELVLEGQETELDRSVIEEISDPLIHLIRNAIDHGVETPAIRSAAGKTERGTIKLSARHEENFIVIEVQDDGHGIDIERVKSAAVEKGILNREAADRLSDKEALDLIFAAGLSTAKSVSDVSGRGVGMDIVRTNVERLNGSISIDSVLGKGSVFTVRLPLTLAIIQALMVIVSGKIFAIPLVSVMEALRVGPAEIKTINSREAIQLRGTVLPLLRLRSVLGFDRNGHNGDDSRRVFIVAVKVSERQVGFVVDSLVGEQEIVIKSLSSVMGDVKGISGATILGDGRVAPIIDVPSLVKSVVNMQMAQAV